MTGNILRSNSTLRNESIRDHDNPDPASAFLPREFATYLWSQIFLSMLQCIATKVSTKSQISQLWILLHAGEFRSRWDAQGFPAWTFRNWRPFCMGGHLRGGLGVSCWHALSAIRYSVRSITGNKEDFTLRKAQGGFIFMENPIVMFDFARGHLARN